VNAFASLVNMKSLLGLALAFGIGVACRTFGIPSPAPPVLVGALLVVAMTSGYLLVDRLMTRPAIHRIDCGGPSGLAPSGEVPLAYPSNASGARALSAGSAAALALAAGPVLQTVALLGLCAAYLQGGLQKLLDFGAAVSEAQHFGLPAAPLIAAATIATELGGSILVLSGFYRWIGALGLAGFTLIATFVANRFWEIAPTERFMVENAFFEHLGLVGGFLLVAILDVRRLTSAGESHVHSQPSS
jgi:XapX domain-containing protein